MIEVRAHARLHFGLFSLAAGAPCQNVDGAPVVPARHFGGVGLMVEEPRLVLRAEPAREWCATGPMAERALEAAKRFLGSLSSSSPSPPGFAGGEGWGEGGLGQQARGANPPSPPSPLPPQSRGERGDRLKPLSFIIERAPPEHSGFGSGTQLALAVAKALAIAARQQDLGAVELASRVGRGLRSAIGIHGFEHGGLIVEAGKLGDEPVAPLVARAALPPAWRVVVAVPQVGPGLHGGTERLAFERLATDPRTTDVLSRLVLLGMLPALREGDCRTFGEALYDFNARVGEQFAAAQGGRYADSRCAEIVAFLRGLGITGVGQSSWGPALFAIVEDIGRANDAAERLQKRFTSVQTWVTKAAGPVVVTA